MAANDVLQRLIDQYSADPCEFMLQANIERKAFDVRTEWAAHDDRDNCVTVCVEKDIETGEIWNVEMYTHFSRASEEYDYYDDIPF